MRYSTVLTILLFFCFSVNVNFAGEAPSKGRNVSNEKALKKKEVKKGRKAGGDALPYSPNKAKKSPLTGETIKTPGQGKTREPFSIMPELLKQKEEVEPPELRVTGIMGIKGKMVATVELNLEDFDGTVTLEQGMRVSIPKPYQKRSESKKWMTYFTVDRISRNGIRITLENGEIVWFPVMGEKNYD